MTGSARVVFMGTPEFALPVLRALAVDPGMQVVACVTQPDRPVGRRRQLTPPPVKVAASELGIPVLQPERAGAPEFIAEVQQLAPDVLVTAAYGQLLPQRLLDVAPFGGVNVHASLLPRWRGAAPIHRAIMAGDAETGVTIMKMVRALDAGPVLAVARVPITDDDDMGTLHDKLAEVGARLLCEVLPEYLARRVEPRPQPNDGVTYAERIRREDEFINWNRTLREVYNHIRGLSPWPGAVTRWDGQDLKVWSAKLVSQPALGLASSAEPGAVASGSEGVFVRCADGWLRLDQVQPAGRRRMTAEEWVRGVTGVIRFDHCTPLA